MNAMHCGKTLIPPLVMINSIKRFGKIDEAGSDNLLCKLQEFETLEHIFQDHFKSGRQ